MKSQMTIRTRVRFKEKDKFVHNLRTENQIANNNQINKFVIVRKKSIKIHLKSLKQ